MENTVQGRVCTVFRIQAHAAARGESTNAFIYRAVQETIQREEED